MSALNENQWHRGVIYIYHWDLWRHIQYLFRFHDIRFSIFGQRSGTPVDENGADLSFGYDRVAHQIDRFALTLALFLETLVHIALQLELYCVAKGDRDAIKSQAKRRLLTQLLPLAFIYLIASIVAGILHFGEEKGDHVLAEDNYSDLQVDNSEVNDEYSNRTLEETSEEQHRRVSGGAATTEYEHGYSWNVADVPLILCFVAALVSQVIQGIEAMFLTPKNINIRSLIVPMNIDFLVHRFGEFTMLFFGEAVMGLLIVETAKANEYYTPIVIGILSVMVLQVFKFESEPHGDCEGHCLWRGLKAFFVYNLLTQALCVGLICFAISFKAGLTTVAAAQKEENNIRRMLSGGESIVTMYAISVLYSISLAIVLTSIALMTCTHAGFKKTYGVTDLKENGNEIHRSCNLKNLFRLTFHVGSIIFVATMFLWIEDNTFANIGIGFGVTIVLALTKAIWNF